VAEDGDAHRQSGMVDNVAAYTHVCEANDDATYCHGSAAIDDDAYCHGGAADNNAA
jgi:hypothetical protein